jgi:hypothetical protein
MSRDHCGTNYDCYTTSSIRSFDDINIFYQNIRGLHTKYTNDSVCVNEPKVICITETCLNDTFYNHSLFPNSCSVFRTDRDYTDLNLTRGGGVLIAVHHSISGYTRKHDLELTKKCVWTEIPVNDGFNLLVGNHYFSPKSDNNMTENYFSSLETKLDTHNFRVVLLGDFNVPGYNWVNGFPKANFQYYTKIRGGIIQNATCYLGLQQCNFTVRRMNLLELVFANFHNVTVAISDFEWVVPDTYHPPMCTDLNILTSCSQSLRYSFRNYPRGDYALLYEILSSYDWSFVYKQTSVDSAVNELNSVVVNSLNQTVPYTCTGKSKFPCWFSGILKHYIKKKNHFFRRYKKTKSATHYSSFFIFFVSL